MKKRFNFFSVLVLALCGVGIGIVVTYTTLTNYYSGLVKQQTVSSSYEGDVYKLAQILAYLDNYFVEDVDLNDLVDSAAEGMISATGDRWSYYVSLDEMADYTEQMNNSYAGIGITITQEDDVEGFPVMAVTEGGPADEAGVQVGDILTAVEGENAAALGMDEAKARVRGQEGTDVALTFTRDGVAYDVTITRGTVDVPVATGKMVTDEIGLVTIENFDNGCADATKAAIEDLTAQGAEAIVFDVRNNPGGLRTELTEILDYLLPEGTIFKSVSYSGETSTDVSDPSYLDLPMAVLVNENSYSAAEYFAACLQEYGAAVVVGTKTSGKGYYQQAFYLDDGSAVSISTGAYYTPSGKSLAGVGITPDVSVDLDDEKLASLYYGQLDPADDDQLQAALQALN